MQGVKVPELRGRLHLREHVALLQPVDLVDGDHHRDTELEDPRCDEPVAGADPLARGDHEQNDVDVLERPSTVSCIRSVSASIGRWKPGRSTSTSC